MAVLKCKMCGGDLDVTDGAKIVECEFCGTTQTVATSSDENLQGLFNRANVLRMKSEFDKAEQLYEKIVQTDETQAEAYWGIILCKYGIEYVEDPTSFKRVPTCHRTSFESVMADEDYKSALSYADAVQRGIYEAEAKEIDRLQKEILVLSEKEEPYDVFICYKETDNDGKRTQDSVIANDIYHQLTQEGLKVFYAAITLEDKLGSAYEPYIFAALNSSKVMLVIGTKPEYFNAVWVKNEWSRYLKLIQKDRSKALIPCYRDMDAYELPEEFAHLQAQDMSKIGFINDVVRGIKKVVMPEQEQLTKQDVITNIPSASLEPLLKRAFMFLEDGDFDSAEEYSERVLDLDPECAQAYWCTLLAKFKCISDEKLVEKMISSEKNLSDDKTYQKAVRFSGANSEYEELNIKIKEHFRKMCETLSEQINKFNSEMAELEEELSLLQLDVVKLNEKKQERQEICERYAAQLKEFDMEYEKYVRMRKRISQEDVFFWNIKQKKELNSKYYEISFLMENCIKEQSRLKRERNAKCKKIDDELEMKENMIMQNIRNVEKLINDKKIRMNKLSQEKDELLKLC